MADDSITKLITLSQEKFAIVDAGDYDFLMQWKWYAQVTGNKKRIYAARNLPRITVNGKTKRMQIRMHQQIMNASYGFEVDHKDGCGLNNRRGNLRIATKHQNQYNVPKRRKNSSSKYKGVWWEKDKRKWRAEITVHGKAIFLGRFNSEESGARAYNQAAMEYHGEFARLNNIT